MEKNTKLKEELKANGLSISWVEKTAELPKNTLANHINQGRSIPPCHLTKLQAVLDRFSIIFEVPEKKD